MADVVVFSAHPWNTVGYLDRFVVDVIEENGITRRGYVCDTDISGLCVNFGPRMKMQVVPFHRLQKPNNIGRDVPDILSQDIEVLLGDRETGPGSWQRGRRISSVRYLENCQTSTNKKQCIIIDGPDRMTQRVRTFGQQSAKVTPETFGKLIVRMPQPTPECQDPAASLRNAVVLPRFHQLWWNTTKTSFISSTEDTVEVLRRDDCRLPVHKASDENHIIYTILWEIPAFLEKFDELRYSAVFDMLDDMVSAVVHLKDGSSGHDQFFSDLPVGVHLLVLSYLDVFDQTLLKRVSKYFIQLLKTRTMRQSIVISNYVKYDVRSLEYTTYRLQKNSFTLSLVVALSVTHNLKVLYLTGKWINCLSPLTQLLQLMSIKLDWLVIAHNPSLQINEFLSFPQPYYILDDPLPIPNYWKICCNLALKGVSFSSNDSICFAIYGSSGMLSGERSCCCRPFVVKVSCWCYNLVHSTEEDWNTSVRGMFNDFCAKLSDAEFTILLDLVRVTTHTDTKENRLLWDCMDLCFSLWNVEPPEDIQDLCWLYSIFPQKNIILRMLGLLVKEELNVYSALSSASSDFDLRKKMPD